MKKIYIIVLTFFIVLGIVFTVSLFSFVKPGESQILIDSNVPSKVYIDGRNVGTTPYTAIYPARNISVKIIANDSPASPFETNVSLVAGVRTIVKHNFSKNISDSSGEIFTFEENGSNLSDLSIVTTPTQASVYVDDVYFGSAPVYVSNLTEGEHKLQLKRGGFDDYQVTLNTIAGYILTASISMARDVSINHSSVEQNKIATDESKIPVSVLILQTKLGYLPVRMSPSADANEIGRVFSNKTYTLVEKDSESGWYRIKFENNLSGWVSPEFVKAL